MSRSPAISGKATATKSLKEKWSSRVQSTREKGENEIGGSSTITMTTADLPSGQEKTGWRWEQWLDKVGEFYRNIIQLREIRRRDDDIIPKNSPQKWTLLWKKKLLPDLDAMDID